tara:strand:+ start:589 stop:1497 length:909 start_codon:yes stop_codon:yes gene_type:complete
MGKYILLLFKLITFSAILISGQRVLANESIKTVVQKGEGKDWIEEIKEEIKAIEQENEAKDWIEELKEEIREVDQERNLKDEIKAEDPRKNKGSGKKIFEEIGTGLSEKGIYLDFLKNSNAKNTFGIRVNYLPEDFFTHKDIYVDDTNVKAEYFGIGMLYQRFLFPKESRSNFYLQANADISTFKLSHDIDLTKETYTQNNVQYTCSACGILTIQTDPDKVHIIPTISLGYQYKIKPNFKTNLSIGIQYIDFGTLENFTNTEYNLPSYVQTRVDDWVQKSQNKIDNYSEFQPSINIGLSYSF